MKKLPFILLFTFIVILSACAQKLINVNNSSLPKLWNDKQYAVALTYDDGLDVHLDNVIPIVDSLGFKVTFYVHGNSRSLYARPQEWGAVVSNGHELGSHSIFHPCQGESLGRKWVNPDYDLDTYTIKRMEDELKLSKTLFDAIDKKQDRTYAYPCGDTLAGTSSYIHLVRNEFSSARLVGSRLNHIDSIDLFEIYCYSSTGRTGNDLIEIAKKAKKENAFVVFLFHGVGGGHALNISIEEHNKLMNYLQMTSSDHWLAPMKEITDHIKEYKHQLKINKN